MIALLLAGCATLGPCAGGSEPPLELCYSQLGDEVETRVVFVGNGELDFAPSTALWGSDDFLHVLPTEADYDAFWGANVETLGAEKVAIDFTDKQAVVANGNGVACQTNTRLRGLFTATDGMVAWVYRDDACGDWCDTYSPPRIEVWEVPKGEIGACWEDEGCWGDSGNE